MISDHEFYSTCYLHFYSIDSHAVMYLVMSNAKNLLGWEFLGGEILSNEGLWPNDLIWSINMKMLGEASSSFQNLS